jgi:hypothetical protein
MEYGLSDDVREQKGRFGQADSTPAWAFILKKD